MSIDSKHSDRVGIILSTLCIIHCIGFPLLITLFPLLENVLPIHERSFHTLMFFLVLIPVLMTFIPHYLQTKRWQSLSLPFASILLLFFSNIIFHIHDLIYETIINVLASSLLVYAHFKHLKAKKCCDH